jgi:hypothetical protein
MRWRSMVTINYRRYGSKPEYNVADVLVCLILLHLLCQEQQRSLFFPEVDLLKILLAQSILMALGRTDYNSVRSQMSRWASAQRQVNFVPTLALTWHRAEESDSVLRSRGLELNLAAQHRLRSRLGYGGSITGTFTA